MTLTEHGQELAKCPELNLQALKDSAENVFDHSVYNTVLKAAKVLFGPQYVTHTDSSITIKHNINLHLSLSWNETKIYFYSFIYDGPEAQELRYKNRTFRVFYLEGMIQYLQLKHIENEMIENIEG